MGKKKVKCEKETKKLIEGISDLVKRKNDKYKFKSKKKKVIKKVKKTCFHWVERKGKLVPAVKQDPENPGNWKCQICGHSFPIKPLDSKKDYTREINNMIALVDQMQFWSVKLGGDKDDTKMFIELKQMLPRFEKVSRQILKRVNQREEFEENRKNGDSMSQFDVYNGINYR